MAGMMPAVYTQPRRVEKPSMPAQPLTTYEREEIRVGLERDESHTAIAVRLGHHRCTISAEVNRNGGRAGYSATRADQRALPERARPKIPLLAADWRCRRM